MSNDSIQQEEELQIPSRKESLKEKLEQMGVKYHHNASEKTLEKLYNKAIGEDSDEAEETTDVDPATETPQQKRLRIRKEATKLIRVVVNCKDPNKRDWRGEVITVANSAVGTVKKYVPFDNEDGWHIPQIVYNVLKEKKLQQFKTAKAKNGIEVRKGYQVPAYNITVLPPLTEDEIGKLADDQRARQAID